MLSGTLIGVPSILWFAQASGHYICFSTFLHTFLSRDLVVLRIHFPVKWAVEAKKNKRFQSWRHGTGPFSGRKGYTRAYPIVTGVGGIFNFITFVMGVLLMDLNYPAALVRQILSFFFKFFSKK